jgi:hypothetical protein
MATYEVIVVSGERIAEVTVTAKTNGEAGRKGVKLAEKAQPSRIYVLLSTRKVG